MADDTTDHATPETPETPEIDERKTVRELRQALGWSQVDLAFYMKKSLSTISNVEAGEQEPRIHLAQLFADTLGVPLGDIRWLKASTRHRRSPDASKKSKAKKTQTKGES